MWSNCSFLSLPDPLEPVVVASDRAPSMGQIEKTMRANEWLMLNYDCHIWIFEILLPCEKKKKLWFVLECYLQKCVYKACIIHIYVFRGFGIKQPTMVDMP